MGVFFKIQKFTGHMWHLTIVIGQRVFLLLLLFS